MSDRTLFTTKPNKTDDVHTTIPRLFSFIRKHIPPFNIDDIKRNNPLTQRDAILAGEEGLFAPASITTECHYVGSENNNAKKPDAKIPLITHPKTSKVGKANAWASEGNVRALYIYYVLNLCMKYGSG